MAEPETPPILRPKIQSVTSCLRPTWAEVDLEAVAHNFAELQTRSGIEVLPVIKADAYGHGVIPVAQRLVRAGAPGFAVALAEEAIELRDAGIDRPVLILNGVVGDAHREVLRRDLVPVVYDLRELKAFHAAAEGASFRVHLKVDTGMARLGVPMSALPAFLDATSKMPGLVVSGLMTHLAIADSDDAYTHAQLDRFEEAATMVRAAGHAPVLHASNSAASFRYPRAHYDMVRPGLALFGDAGFATKSSGLKPALRLRTQVISVRHLVVGDRAGYAGVFVAQAPARLAVLPVGYADGVLRSSASGGHVLIGGKRCPYVGRISMDLAHVDVTHIPEVQVGDEAVLLGSQGDETLSARDLADAAGTIPYEIMTSVSRRVPRVYS